MKLATTTGDFKRYGCDQFESIDHICHAGFKCIDLDLYDNIKSDVLFTSRDWRDHAKRLKEHADSLGASFVQAHSPSGNPLDKAGFDELLETTIRSIDVCGELGIGNIVVHSGFVYGMGKTESFKKNREYYQKLFSAMERNNVNVLCENGSKKNLPEDTYFLDTGEEIKEFTEYVNHPLFHICWDTGHANMDGAQYEHILAMGDDLRALHINDNRGMGDEHIIPYFGTVNMDEIMNALVDIGYNGYFTFEASETLRKKIFWQGNRRSFEKEERLAEPELFMQCELEKLMYNIGAHILSKYNCFEQ